MNCSATRYTLCGNITCITCHDKSFASHPKATYWSDKNLLEPYEVFKSANTKYYFTCNECKHELYMTPNKVSTGQWCKYCNSNGLCEKEHCEPCFTKSFASHPKSSCWSNKNEVSPIQLSKHCNKKFWFNCEECRHELHVSLNSISSGNWCKYCNAGQLCDLDNCNMCFEKSMASHPIGKYWSCKNEISARYISKGSEKKCWFMCNECKHDYVAVPYSLTSDNHCSYCSNQKLCDNDDCMYCYNKSCASHKMKEEWSHLNDKTPRQVFLQSNKKIVFDCNKCKHQYSTSPTKCYNRDEGCSYCSNTHLCENVNCLTCFNKSFASHPRVRYLSNKNSINPRNIFKGSETKCIFNCDKCNLEFESRLYNVLSGYWCPFCKNKTEGKLWCFLQKEYSNCRKQLRFDWCRYSKTNNHMPIDFGLCDKKILIELDGEQHFTQVSNWNCPEETMAKDIEKINKIIENGYSIIHISQLDIWFDKYDWKTVLINAINDLNDAEPTAIFISSTDCYKNHINGVDVKINKKYITP